MQNTDFSSLTKDEMGLLFLKLADKGLLSNTELEAERAVIEEEIKKRKLEQIKKILVGVLPVHRETIESIEDINSKHGHPLTVVMPHFTVLILGDVPEPFAYLYDKSDTALFRPIARCCASGLNFYQSPNETTKKCINLFEDILKRYHFPFVRIIDYVRSSRLQDVFNPINPLSKN